VAITAGEGPVEGEDEACEDVTFAVEVADMAGDPWVQEPLVLTKKAAKAGGSSSSDDKACCDVMSIIPVWTLRPA
jgi:hypothetical protein